MEHLSLRPPSRQTGTGFEDMLANVFDRVFERSARLPLGEARRCARYGRRLRDQANRMIRTGKLNALLRVHTRPINVMVYHDPQGNLVSRLVSRLDAFSGYLFRT